MASMAMFWEWFDQEAFPQLGIRAVSFRKIFEYLDRFAEPVTIIETGCLRTPGNWEGDGQSTLLFDRYIGFRGDDSRVFSVDLAPEAVEAAQSVVSAAVEITVSDSVTFLNALAARLTSEPAMVHLLYLDSFDFDPDNPVPAAAHHLKELVAIKSRISPATLVVIDDCPQSVNVFPDSDGNLAMVGASPKITGKGRFVAEYAEQVNVTPFFIHYQCAWVGL